MFWAYVLECADGSYYTGHTDDGCPKGSGEEGFLEALDVARFAGYSGRTA
jgi:hypothetical protein